MICTNCGKRIKKALIKCPFCGERIIDKDSFELPQLKPIEEKEETIIELSPIDYNLSDNDYSIELKEENNDSEDFDRFVGLEEFNQDLLEGKTQRISFEEDNSLVDEINRQIENMDIESETIAPSVPIETTQEHEFIENDEEQTFSDQMEEYEDDTLSSEESLKKRRKIFFISIILVVILVIVSLTLYSYYKNHDFTNTKPYEEKNITLEEKLSKSLDNFYNNGNIDDIKKILEDYKNEEEKITQIQETTKEKTESWVTEYYEKEILSKKDFNIESNNIKEKLNNLHAYGVIQNDTTSIKILTDSDYNTLMEQVNAIYKDSVTYFDAMELYNSNDYNKAYSTLETITSKDRYYSKAVTAKEKVINAVLNILKDDIEMMSTGIDELNDEAKLNRYIQIEEIIFGYKNVYHSVNLDNSDEYRSILKKYSDLVEEYTNK